MSALGALGASAFGSAQRAGSVAPAFDPFSVTFVSLEQGWALGNAPCGSKGGCLALRETTDAGRSWSAVALPAALLTAADRRVSGGPADLDAYGGGLNVRFADPQDGWIYGALAQPASTDGATSLAATLWSTHDGGAIWQRQNVSGTGQLHEIYDLEAAHGTAWLLQSNPSYGDTVKSTPVSSDDWRVDATPRLGGPAGGSEPSGSFVFAGASGWLVEGNDRGVYGSARLLDGRWASWTPPCADVGHSFAIPAASTPQNLVAVCTIGGFAYPLPKAAPPGAKLGSDWLYFSSDGGASFTAGPQLAPAPGPNHGYFSFGAIASPTPATILLGRGEGSGQDLTASFDGGRHWGVVYHATPTYIGFTSPSQGVAIVSSGGGDTQLIMSFDGGHHWAPVSF
jgi:hypothetical protein